MDPLQPTLTKAGLAAIVADSGPAIGPVAITQIGLTDTAFTPSSTLTALPGEFTRLAVSGEASGDDTIATGGWISWTTPVNTQHERLLHNRRLETPGSETERRVRYGRECGGPREGSGGAVSEAM